MNFRNDGRNDWFAYFLGELPEAERGRVEEEMAVAPEEAEEVRRAVEAATAWAQQPESYEPLALDAVIQDGRVTPFARPPAARAPRWFWAAAAAALVVLAVSQTRFSVTMGDTTFAWGRPAATSTTDTLVALAAKLAEVESKHAKTEELVASVAERTLAVEESAAQLAYNQQVEAETRYQDMATLIQRLSGGDEMASAVFER